MKTTHHNPLFHEKTLARVLATYPGPQDMEGKRKTIGEWVNTLRRGTLDVINETSLHGDFLRDIFGNVLGYPNRLS
jgi:hypothetical protein